MIPYLAAKIGPYDMAVGARTGADVHVPLIGYDFVWQLNFDFEGQLARELALFDQFTARCARLVYDEGENGQVYALLERCED